MPTQTQVDCCGHTLLSVDFNEHMWCGSCIRRHGTKRRGWHLPSGYSRRDDGCCTVMTMDTFEARLTMRDLAQRGLAAIDRFRGDETNGLHPLVEVRGLQMRARAVLADAGYPGEAVWRALNQAYLGFEVYQEEPASAFWGDIDADLRAGMATLDGLLTPGGLGADFPIVG